MASKSSRKSSDVFVETKENKKEPKGALEPNGALEPISGVFSTGSISLMNVPDGPSFSERLASVVRIQKEKEIEEQVAKKRLEKMETKFNNIKSFVEDLANVNKNLKDLVKYKMFLIEYIKDEHLKSKKEQVTLFDNFCNENRDVIIELSEELLPKLVFKDGMSIDFKNIFKNAHIETKVSIWKHLWVITNGAGPIPDFKNKFMDISVAKIEIGSVMKSIAKLDDDEDNTDPGALFGSLMQSGMVANLLSGKGSGKPKDYLRLIQKSMAELDFSDDEDEKENGKTVEEKALEKKVDEDVKKSRKLRKEERDLKKKAIEEGRI